MEKVNKKIVVKKLNEIVPYWRNPRINDFAVEKVKKSIKEYGYVKRILIDKDNVIIAGHVRYKALLELGYDEVECLQVDLDPKKAKEYRIIDNKTSEFATWNKDLDYELKEFSNFELRDYFFPQELEKIPDLLKEQIDYGDYMVKVMCPDCMYEYMIKASEVL